MNVPVRKTVVAGNWKLHKTPTETRRAIIALKNKLAGLDTKCDVVICPPMVCLETAVDAAKDTDMLVGAQNVFWEESGAFTGEVSTTMLQEMGVDYVIIGHSERRAIFGETDEMVAKKLARVLDGSLAPIVCVGEVLEERESGATREVLTRQVRGALGAVAPDHVKRVVLAYEPVWAIGTGRTASPEIANEAHTLIRNTIAAIFGRSAADETSVLYGGSVKPDNAAELMRQSEVDGVLVGGASLDPSSFVGIIKAAG
ncbi:MAG: triose-phosphate isomerase [Candidatus Eisenbacteria bacterium]|nr:triose-phosphate isomerase [Candidatus Eisenbacteria bacterium]